tara:strand:- start:3056 stop:3661 length:606 start_codon:yes stop_codon:yes gene_type:complete
MYKIAAFITFDKNLEKKILYQKFNVKKKFGNQTYLNHPVHLTLFTININKLTLLKKIYKNFNKKNLKNNFIVQIKKPGVFFNDPITKGHTLYYNLKKNNFLMKAQMKHLRFINRHLLVKKDKNNFNNRILDNNYKKYGFPFAGKIWIPHITIASINGVKEDDKYIKKFLKSKINYKSIIKDIEFYKVSNDKHQFLFKTNIN